jgi:hypothetical protein
MSVALVNGALNVFPPQSMATMCRLNSTQLVPTIVKIEKEFKGKKDRLYDVLPGFIAL